MDITLDDFIQKYQNAYVFLKTKQGDILAKFEEATDNLIFYSAELGEIYITFDNAKKVIITKFPKIGIYNVGEYLFSLVYRVPEKQFKASPCNKNTAIKTVYLHNKLDINHDTLSETFNPNFPTKPEAKKLCVARGGVALSDKFGITLSDKNEYDLYYHLNKIGNINSTDLITVEYTPLLQEVKDFFGDDLVWKS